MMHSAAVLKALVLVDALALCHSDIGGGRRSDRPVEAVADGRVDPTRVEIVKVGEQRRVALARVMPQKGEGKQTLGVVKVALPVNQEVSLLRHSAT
jgi:hypothetical protein